MAKDLDNRILITGIAAHDRKIIQHLLKTIQPVIINTLMKRNAGRDQAADIFMDSLEAIYREIQKNGVDETIAKLDNPPKTKLQTYLTRINLNLYFNQARRKKIKVGVTEEQEKLYSENETITDELHQVMQRKLFLEKLNQLGTDCQKVLRLFFERKSMKEISHTMNTTEQYAKKKKFTCKKKLIELIKRDHRYRELST